MVVGLDLGTTSAKAVAVDTQARTWAQVAHAYPLHSPRPGWAEQEPADVIAAAMRALATVVEAARSHGADVKGVSVSAAMHSVLAVDAAGQPLTPALTYADSRAADLAEALRGTPEAREMYERTGVPTHPMSPLLKIRWFGENDPAVAARAARWVSLKEHVLAHLGAEPGVDHSVASGTAMFDLREQRWHAPALEFAGIGPEQLAPLLPTTALIEASALDVPIVIGAGDGALANLGAGALSEGVAALSIGTSGAVRIASRQVRTDAGARLFCNALTTDRWVVGGAISNGGIILRWLRDRLFSRDGVAPITYETLTELATGVPPGCEGLLWLPYLTAERAPRWDPSPRGALLGMDLRHGPGHVIRAGMEGVALQLRWVVDAIMDSGCSLDAIRATGGFTDSPVWVQILADVLGRDVAVPDESEGSSVGGALLGMVALGLLPDIDTAAGLIKAGTIVRPNTGHSATYDRVYSAFRDAQPILGPAMHVLEQLREAADRPSDLH